MDIPASGESFRLRRGFILFAIVPLALFALNLWISWRLFFTEYLVHFGSIEPVFYALADAIRTQWPHLNWWPQWFCGMPFAYTYQPLLHYTVALISGLGGFSAARAFHIVLAVIYSLGPVCLYALVFRLSHRWDVSILTGLLYSLWSPSTLLMSDMAGDTGGIWKARRLHSAVVWGDGPYVAGLTLVPLAILLLDWAVRSHKVARGGAIRWLAASLAIAAVVATNIPATISLAMGLLAYVLSVEAGRFLRASLAAVGASAFGYLLIAWWIPPSALWRNAVNAQWMDSASRFDWVKIFQLLIAAALLAAISYILRRFNSFEELAQNGVRRETVPDSSGGARRTLCAPEDLARTMERRYQARSAEPGRVSGGVEGRAGPVRAPEYLRFGVLFTVITSGIVLGNAWFHISLVAQAGRFHLVMEMAIVTAVAAVAVRLTDGSRCCRRMLLLGTTLMCVVQIVHYRAAARRIIDRANVTTRSEYKIARWMDQHVNGGRVLAPGSVSFWLNAFTITPQLKGCCDQNELFRAPDFAYYQVLADNGPGSTETSLVWLRALGVQYIALCGPGTTEQYGDSKYPHKFDGVLPTAWQDGGDSILEVPARSSSLAHVVAPSELIVRMPANQADVAPLENYVAAIQDPARPEAQFQWDPQNGANIRAIVPRGSVVSVQIPYQFGWRATAAGWNIPVSSDALGMMVLAPDCDGTCGIRLIFDGGTEAKIVGIASLLGWIAALLAIVVSRRRERSAGATIEPEESAV